MAASGSASRDGEDHRAQISQRTQERSQPLRALRSRVDVCVGDLVQHEAPILDLPELFCCTVEDVARSGVSLGGRFNFLLQGKICGYALREARDRLRLRVDALLAGHECS